MAGKSSQGGLVVRWRAQLDAKGIESLDYDHGTAAERADPQWARLG